MAAYLRPLVTMGLWDQRNNGPYGPWAYRSFRNSEFYADSNTPWIKFWLRLPHLWPTDLTPPVLNNNYLATWPGMTPNAVFTGMVAEIQAARAQGLKVILGLREFPQWTNRTNVLTGPNPRDGPEFTQEQRTAFEVFCPPDDVAENSPWAWMITYLMAYFHPLHPSTPGAYVDFLEIMNEPNLEWWPQKGWDGNPHIHRWAARMCDTAHRIQSDVFDGLPLLLAPGLADWTEPPQKATRTPWHAFMDRMLTHFDAMGFRPDQNFAWSMHNYLDVERQRRGSANANAVAGAREKLKLWGDWAGWPPPGAATNPYVNITEGGARQNELPIIALPPDQRDQKQSDLVAFTWHTMHDAEHDESVGVGMIANYLFWSASGFDSGLCKAIAENASWQDMPNPEERLAFYRWRDLPTDAR